MEANDNETKRVFVTDHISEEGIEKLREFAEVDVALELSTDELKERIAGYDALVVRSGTKVTKEIIEAGSRGRLKVIGRAGVGVDNVDVETATEKGILVVNAPEANTISAAEHTIAMLLSLSRKIPAANLSLKSGQWDRKKHMGVEVNGKVLGIIGLGRVGSEVAKRAKGLGMRVVAYDPFITEERGRELGIALSNFNEVLQVADFITLHTPLTKDTHHLIGKREFALMKDGVRVLNCARGGII
ncbi:MAG: hydroxyacid dehydrogenase, partial [archaeon]|nr:hydroxyacid dehydrogenase [archaeon]